MMVKPPSSVSFITCGSKSSGTLFGSGDLSGCLRSFFTCAPLMRKHPLSQYRSRMDCRILLLSNSSDFISTPADVRNSARCTDSPARHARAHEGANRMLAGMRILFATSFVNKFYLAIAASTSPPAVTARQKCSLMRIGAPLRGIWLTIWA